MAVDAARHEGHEVHLPLPLEQVQRMVDLLDQRAISIHAARTSAPDERKACLTGFGHDVLLRNGKERSSNVPRG
jgi:hypothetical protein